MIRVKWCYDRRTDADDVYRSIAIMLQRMKDAEDRSAAEVAGLLEMIEVLVQILAGKGFLTEGHQRLLAKVREKARPDRPKVRLRLYVDKYPLPNSGVDCDQRMHLCHARCCAFTVELSRQDLDEGLLLWQVEEPYLLRREADGLCSHLDRSKGSCGIYQNRPAACRSYDCRNDTRIWEDFEKRIPAPMPERLSP